MRDLSSRGHAVHVVLPPYDNRAQSGRRYRDGGLTVENVVLPRFTSFCSHLLLAARLLCAVLAYRADMVHLFKPKGYGGIVCQLLLALPRWFRPRVVVDSDDWEGDGGWNDLVAYPPTWRRLFNWQERFLLSHADAVTVASRELERRVRQLRDTSVVRVPNGADVPLALSSPPPGAPHLLLFSRLYDMNPNVVIPVLERLLVAEPRLRITIAGGALHDERAVWSNLLCKTPFAHRLVVVDWIPPEHLPALFASAHVALVALDDTFLNRCRCSAKVAALLAAGVPVVATSVGENTLYIRDGRDGLLVRPDDVIGLTTTTLRLLRDRRYAQMLGKSARDRMATVFNWSRLAGEVESLYLACYPFAD